MGVFGRDQSFDLMIFNDNAKGDPKDPATIAARKILGLPLDDEDDENNDKNVGDIPIKMPW